MRAAIIAAGKGSRLAQSRAGIIKPLLLVAGRPLSHWIVDGLVAAGVKSVTVLTNSRGNAVAPSLSAAFPGVEFDFVTADTASSFESFRLVSLRLAKTEESFVVSTVDALIKPDDVARFVAECRTAEADAGLALTLHVDDERPLWVDVDEVDAVTAVGENATTRRAVTCGLYYMTRKAAKLLPSASTHARLRDFLTKLVADIRVRGVLLSMTIDVDRPEDLDSAESFLTTETRL